MKFASEQDLASRVVEWLHEHGWETWQEVRVGRGGPCADIVARLGPMLWIIECKQSMSLAVMQQAYQWIGMANRVSVATPVGNRRNNIPDAICRALGFGWIQVGSYCDERVSAKFWRRTRANIGQYLHDGQKECAAAGTNRGGMWTPFRQTCMNLGRYVREHPGCTMKEAIDAIEHHYARSATARSALSHWLRLGKVDGIEARRDGRFVRLYVEQT